MQVSFPGTSFESIDLPDSRLLGVYGPSNVRVPGSVEEQMVVALAQSIGSEPLGARLRPGMNVLVIVGDRTSPAPAARLLPILLTAIQNAGVARQDVGILVATASRRPMTSTELRQKLGEPVLQNYLVSQHDWRDWSGLINLGDTADGYPVVVDRRIANADFVIGMHDVVPDRVAGFSGGYEIIAPGCLGDTHSTLDVRWQAARYPTEAILGIADNPIRRIVDDVGRIAGLDYVVQVILDGRGEVAGIVAGDPIAAYRTSTTTALQIYGIDLPGRADVVIADARTDDVDLFQAAKALYAASLAVRPGGAILLVAACPEGVAPTHPRALHHGIQSVAAIEHDLSLGKITDVVGAAFLAMVSRAIENLGGCYLISRGVSASDAACLGFQLAASPKEALGRAWKQMGRDASVLVLRQATTLFPHT